MYLLAPAYVPTSQPISMFPAESSCWLPTRSLEMDSEGPGGSCTGNGKALCFEKWQKWGRM